MYHFEANFIFTDLLFMYVSTLKLVRQGKSLLKYIGF